MKYRVDTKLADDNLINKIEKQSLKAKSQTDLRIARQFFFISNVVNQNQKKKNSDKRSTWWILFLGYVNIIFLFGFYIFWIYSQQYPNEDLYNQFIDNQNNAIIEDIISIDNSSQCPKEYENLFEYNWPGTNFGCDCSKILKEKNNQTLFNYMCNETLLNRGCKPLYEIKEKKLNKLNDNSFSKPFILCSKRRQGVSLRYNFSYCQEQEKTICGSGSFTYCLPKNVDCPISQIGFTQQFNQQQNSQYDKIFKVSNGLYFYYIKNQTLMPISQIQMTETSQVCKQNSLNNISPNRSDYFLMKIRRKPCLDNDTQFKVVYNINEDQFYLANNLIALNRQLKYFKVNSSVVWTLQTKAYTQIKDSCQYESNYENFLEKQDLQNIKNERYLVDLLIIPISLLLFKQLFTHLTKLKYKQKRKFCCFGLIHFDLLLILIFRILKIASHVLIIAFISIEMHQFKNSKQSFQTFVTSQCIVTELASNFYDFNQLSDSEILYTLKIITILIQAILIVFLLFKLYQEGFSIIIKSCQQGLRWCRKNCQEGLRWCRKNCQVLPVSNENNQGQGQSPGIQQSQQPQGNESSNPQLQQQQNNEQNNEQNNGNQRGSSEQSHLIHE
ncbi:unnamed protein product [Paramecium sonneborni]|uniref:Transmembrane protein n=1 Tax=Paramecium sonneborni TaxID=65129 RepID=A0A8S1L757_9CILI|nr:unnamed protein product [Paramecium sonneborni]